MNVKITENKTMYVKIQDPVIRTTDIETIVIYKLKCPQINCDDMLCVQDQIRYVSTHGPQVGFPALT